MFRLDGKIALISGASRGIGEEVAKLYAKAGAKVIVSSRKLDGLESVVEQIGEQAQAKACNIGDQESIEKLIGEIKEEHGRIDILVNNAAANPYFGHILDTPLSAAQKTIQVNIQGYYLMSQLAGQLMRENGGGCIINTSSVNGVSPGPMQGVYSVTKAAILSMTKAFAKECAPQNIRVNAVLPGLTDTKFASALTKNEQMLKMILPLIPMNRMAQPEEIAPIYLFLASDAAKYITGVEVPVDGGLLA